MRKPVKFFLVEYEESDWVGFLLAWLCFAPPFIVAMQTACWLTLLAASFAFRRMPKQIRGLDIAQRRAGLFLLGQVLNEFFNLFLKNTIQQDRPDNGHSYVDFGMPSSHAQFMAFFVAVLPGLVSDASQTILEGKHQKMAAMLVQGAALAGAVLVAYARIHLGYHTSEQVLVGSLTGFLAGHCWKLIQRVK